LPNTATTDFLLFQIGEVEAGRLLAVPGQPHDELGGGCPNQQQKKTTTTFFGSGWTAANIMSESALRGLKKVLK
jgi:hypothetical protein